MADTYTTNLNLTKPEPGAAEDTWGISLNADLDALDAIFSSSGTQINLNPNQINFADGKKAVFGNSSDLQIYHDGLNSHIKDTGTGDLLIEGSDNIWLMQSGGNKVFLNTIDSNAINLYFNNSKKLETTNTGVLVTGSITTDGMTTSADINFGDDDKALFGAGNDLKIYHSANNQSYIHEVGTGDLNILATNLKLQDSGGSTKVLVNSTGINVTGTVTSDSALLSSTSGGTLTLEDSDATSTFNRTEFSNSAGTLNINTRQSNGTFVSTDYQILKNASGSTLHRLLTQNKKRLDIGSGGDISFYDDTGSTQGFFWDASAERLAIGNTAPTQALDVTGAITSSGNIFMSTNGSILRNTGGALQLQSDASQVILRSNNTTALTLDTSQNATFAGAISAEDNIYLTDAGTIRGRIELNASDRDDLDIVAVSLSSNLKFFTQNTEVGRIDASGNLLVGKTSTSGSTAGISLKSNGQLEPTVSGSYVSYFNRTSSDGPISYFAKDGSIVGSIGTQGSVIRVGSGNNNLGFFATRLQPLNSSGVGVDGTIDLGYSTSRFKDLHLSGNVNASAAYIDGYIYHTGDTDTYINYSTDNIILSAGGPVMHIKGSGRVGVGTSSPSSKLEVKSSGSNADEITLVHSGNTAKIASLGQESSHGSLILRNNSGTNQVRLSAGGNNSYLLNSNFGIGITSPSALLHIQSEDSTTDDAVNMMILTALSTGTTTTGFGPAILLQGERNNGVMQNVGRIRSIAEVNSGTNISSGLAFETSTAGVLNERVRISYDGHVGIGTANHNVHSGTGLVVHATTGGSGNTGSPRIRLTNTTTGQSATDGAELSLDGNTKDFYIENREGQDIIFYSGSERLRIDSSGNVGIGDTAPQDYLEINGSGKGLGGLTISNSSASHAALSFARSSTATARIKTSEPDALHTSALHFQTSNASGGSPNLVTAMYIDENQRVGIGTTSPSTALEVNNASAGATVATFEGTYSGSGDVKLASFERVGGAVAAAMEYNDATTDMEFGTTTSHNFSLKTADTRRLTITSAGDVSISGNVQVGIGNSKEAFIQATNSGRVESNPAYSFNGDVDTGMFNPNTDNTIAFATAGTERVRINSSGYVGINMSNPSTPLDVAGIIKITESSNTAFYGGNYVRVFSDQSYGFRNSGGTTKAQISMNGNSYFNGGNIGIGTALPDNVLHVQEAALSGRGASNGNTSLTLEHSTDTGIQFFSATQTQLRFGDAADTGAGAIIYTHADNILRLSAANAHRFTIGGTEAMRIDSSQNLLVGKTSLDYGEAGAEIMSTGTVRATVGNGHCLLLNRKTSDGVLIDLRRDNVTKAQIGILSASAGNDAYFSSGSSSTTGVGLRFIDVTTTNAILPCRGDGTTSDNLIDLGSTANRFDDIYATNGTIQTSDRNDKQDIQALTDAEQRVATACKGLIRRFRWQDAVEEKGDDARLHFGVIAQDLQDAFTAEGLDAGDYGMFISSTWTDDDGNEQTRLGVRYNELLAFIITTL